MAADGYKPWLKMVRKPVAIAQERSLCAKSRHCQVYAEPHHVDEVELIGLTTLGRQLPVGSPRFRSVCWNRPLLLGGVLHLAIAE
jgi:hypothetical protein